jgi:hypothetical protein
MLLNIRARAIQVKFYDRKPLKQWCHVILILMECCSKVLLAWFVYKAAALDRAARRSALHKVAGASEECVTISAVQRNISFREAYVSSEHLMSALFKNFPSTH